MNKNVPTAHCTAPRTVSNTRAVVGAIHRSTGGATHNLARFINHPQYQSQTLTNDVSLIQTVNNIAFNNMVAPVALGSSYVGGGVNAVATGFGQVCGIIEHVTLFVFLIISSD